MKGFFKRFLITFLVLLSIRVVGSVSVTKFAAVSSCTNSYPTAFVTGSFAINETKILGNQAFRKNQTNKTLIIGFSNSVCAFNPSTGTVSATDAEVTINGYTIAAAGITVNVSTSSTNQNLTAIQFKGIQVNGQSTGTSFICRIGGTFSIDNSTANPASGLSIGDFSFASPLAVSQNSTTQTSSADLFPNMIANPVLQVEITFSGTCGSPLSITSLTFSTIGTGLASQNPTTNLSLIRVYYTGVNEMFNKTSLYGTASVVNGSFVVSGSQLISAAGSYHFWLCYDISNSPNNGDQIDGSFLGFTASGTSYSATSGNPSGTARAINTTAYYSISSGLWNNPAIWSLSSGGASCNCVPTGSSAVNIAHSVTLNVNSPNIYLLNINNGGVLTDQSYSLNVLQFFNTFDNGTFTASTSWSFPDLSISGTGTCATAQSVTISGDLSIDNGKQLQLTGGSGKNLVLTGNADIDGTLVLGSSNFSLSNANGAYLDGDGVVSGNGSVYLGIDKLIPSDANLTFSTSVTLAASVTVNNYGAVTIENNLVGTNATTSIWKNRSGSTLAIGGSTGSLLTTGVLDASEGINSVVYKGSSVQAIKTPSSNYSNLELSNSSVKTTSSSSFSVTNNLTISGNTQFSMAAAAGSLFLSGNFYNNSTNSTPISIPYFIFMATDSILGTGVSTFSQVVINGASLTRLNPITSKVFVTADFQNDGEVDPANSDVTFNGTSSLTGNSTAEFYSLILNSGKSLVLNPIETDIAGNLTINGSLTTNTCVLIFNGSANNQTVSGSGNYTVTEIEFNNPSGTITLSSPINVSSSFTLTSGIVQTSSGAMLVALSTASAYGGSASSYVSGPMSKTGSSGFIFPVGKSGRYAPIGVSSMSSSATFKAEYFASAHTNTNSLASSITPTLARVSSVEYWDLNRTSGTTGAIVTLYWSDATASGINNCNNAYLNVAHFNSGAWENASENCVITGTCSGTFSGSIATFSNITSFSPFTFGSKTSGTINVLPISISNFKADCVSGKSEITWNNFSRNETYTLVLEKYTTNESWEPVYTEVHDLQPSKIKAMFVDASAKDINYYRLISINKANERTVHGITDLYCNSNSSNDFQVVYNPSCRTIHVETSVNELKRDVLVQIVNELGVVCFEKYVTLNSGLNTFLHHFEAAPGVYFLRYLHPRLNLPVKRVIIMGCD